MGCFMEEVRVNYHIYCHLPLSSKVISKFLMEAYQLATDLFLPTFTHICGTLVSERLKEV